MMIDDRGFDWFERGTGRTTLGLLTASFKSRTAGIAFFVVETEAMIGHCKALGEKHSIDVENVRIICRQFIEKEGKDWNFAWDRGAVIFDHHSVNLITGSEFDQEKFRHEYGCDFRLGEDLTNDRNDK